MGIFKKYSEDPVYWLGQRNALYGGGKLVAHDVAHNVIGEPLGESVRSVVSPEIANQISSIAAGSFGHAIVGLTTVGLTAGVSAGLTQVDYYRARNNLREFYKEELAAKLKKAPDNVTTNDLDTLATTNRTVAEELNQAKKDRNFGIGLSFIASMASLAVVAFGMPALGMPEPASLFHLFSASAEGLLSLAANVLVSVATYQAVKIPLHWLGDKLFGLDKETTHERIADLKLEHEAGKVISQEQVLSVFAKAHPELDAMIAAQFGQAFDKLALADKQRAVAQIGQMVPLEQLTAEINAGKINVGELAFAVEGQISGVHHERMAPLKKHGLLHGMWHKVRHALSFKPHPDATAIGVAMQSREGAAAVAYAESTSTSGPSFVDRLGRPKLDKSMGYAKLMEQLDQQANIAGSQTIQ